ncbi:hypothetical protein [Neobacillus sp. YIM B06451]|uniref:hypothetical protein n=1 Tax=Neobacillus sp. YIM B06451 TaxID=3070994 RepID=UPI0029312268|nr:hypothetical protein [Neobacillus sp. YIM B06451]
MENKIKNYDEFKDRLKSHKIPTVHYNDSFQRIIMEPNKVVKPIYFRTAFITVFLSVFLTVSVAAMQLTGFGLFNSNGEKIYEVLPMETDKKFTENMLKYDLILEKIRKGIPEGEFVYFLPVDAYEELGLTTLLTLSNGTPINNMSDVPGEMESLSLHGSLLNKYNFSEGTIYYESPEAETESIAEALYKEAKKNDLEYIIQEGTLSSNINFVELKYKINERDFGGVTIRLNPTIETMYTSENLEEYIKITERGTDFLYNKEKQRVLFVVEGNPQKILVEVSMELIDDNFDVKKELLPIALSLLK